MSTLPGKIPSRLKLLAASAALAASFAVNPVQAQQKVMIVLDSSGSMAGQIGGVRKIDIARQAVGSILGKMDAKTQLGLFAYGHRRKGDCGDIQMIHAMGSPNFRSMMRSVNRLRPIGKTPLGDAVRQAARAMRYTEEKATVILVSDGRETCGSDPCALGRELKKQGIDFKVHVVGFNIRRGEESGLQCLARNTGGAYVAANNASSLNKALQTTVKKVEAEPPRPVKVQTPPPAPVKPALNGLKIRAFIKDGGPEWKGTLGVTVLAKPEGLSQQRKKVASAWRVRSGHIVKALKPGDYRVQIVLPDHRHITFSRDITYTGGGQMLDAVLNIGQVRLDVTFKQGGRPFNWALGWTVSSTTADFAGKRKKIASFWRVKTGHVNWLPAGTWRLDGLATDARYMKLQTNIKIEAGGQHVITQSMNAALVRLDAKLVAGAPVFKGQLGWSIFYGKPDLSGKRKKLAGFWRKRASYVFPLPAGEWTIEGVLPSHRHVKFATRLKTEAGAQTPHEVIMNAARVRFDATADGKPVNEQLAFDVLEPTKDLAGKQRKIAGFWRKRSGLVTYLNASKYLLRAYVVKQRNISGQTTIEVKPGQETAYGVNMTVE